MYNVKLGMLLLFIKLSITFSRIWYRWYSLGSIRLTIDDRSVRDILHRITVHAVL